MTQIDRPAARLGLRHVVQLSSGRVHVEITCMAVLGIAEQLEDILNEGGQPQRLTSMDLVVAVPRTGLGDSDGRGSLCAACGN